MKIDNLQNEHNHFVGDNYPAMGVMISNVNFNMYVPL
jgi:hypothetical protein